MKILKYLSVLLLGWTACAQAQLEVTVTGGDVSAVPIAIVPFQQTADIQLDLAQVIDNDLANSGRFRTMPRGDMLQRPSSIEQIDAGTWKRQGMDNVVVGQASKTAAGYSVRFYLMDTIGSQQLLAFDLPSKSAGQLRYVAHQIADLIYEKLLGLPGYFNTKIAYVSSSGSGYNRNYQLIVADADGYNPRAVATSREPLMSPAWSTDRRQLAYVGYERGRSAIYLQTLASGEVRRLISERGINGSPAFSPDGTKLALTLSFENNPDIYIMNVKSGKRRRLTKHYGIDTEAAWSPDGSKIVFTSDRGGQPQIYEMDIDSNDDNPRRVTFEGGQNLRASYSPDGKSLVLVNNTGGSYRIALLDLEGNSMRVVSDGRLDESPSFAPGGAAIIYAAQSGSRAELATVSVDGRVRQRLRQASGDVREPAWSPLAK